MKEVAQGKSAYQSSTYITANRACPDFPYSADLAVDGNTSPSAWSNCSCSHTANYSDASWWLVDLGAVHLISYLLVFNRADFHGGLLSFAKHLKENKYFSVIYIKHI